ncbi:class I SAM-dependent methyltransferase [Pseudotamlana agarivorans]|uniref:class I SAM-dependent methyltransferase n=1 Tax=Pseudotamlana agarivorans TaxID=481183 RepID=UPI000A063CBF|nr:methyltransferase domain-containing protein [Tamlana agarivorans]
MKLSIQSLPVFTAIVLLASCGNNEQQSSFNQKEKILNKQELSNDKPHNHPAHNFSDKNTVEQLASRYESPERDSIERPEQLLAFLGDIKGKTVMDIGAGTGYYSVKLAKNGANVIAADVSSEFQSYLKTRITENNISNISLRKVQYDNPLLENNEVDMVFIANTYHHISNRIDYLAKVKKGLKENGEIVILDYLDVAFPEGVMAPPTKMRVSIDQAIKELKEAGFTKFEIEVNNLPYHYIVKAKLKSL